MVMGPSLPAPGPATGLVTATGNSVRSAQCLNWTITPNGTASSSHPPTVADLFEYTTVNHKSVLQFIGQYYLTFPD